MAKIGCPLLTAFARLTPLHVARRSRVREGCIVTAVLPQTYPPRKSLFASLSPGVNQAARFSEDPALARGSHCEVGHPSELVTDVNARHLLELVHRRLNERHAPTLARRSALATAISSSAA